MEKSASYCVANNVSTVTRTWVGSRRNHLFILRGSFPLIGLSAIRFLRVSYTKHYDKSILYMHVYFFLEMCRSVPYDSVGPSQMDFQVTLESQISWQSSWQCLGTIFGLKMHCVAKKLQLPSGFVCMICGHQHHVLIEWGRKNDDQVIPSMFYYLPTQSPDLANSIQNL